MLKRIPRQVFFVTIFGYLFVAGMIIMTALLLMSSDQFGLVDIVLVAVLVGALALIWWRFHPRLNLDLENTEYSFEDELRRVPHYKLLAFESEYCLMCISLGDRVEALRNIDGLHVYRLSVNHEPGRSLFREYDGRLTPTYVLLDARGNLVQEWPAVLPVERIRYAVSQPA